MKIFNFLILGAALLQQLGCRNSLSLQEFCDQFSRSNPKHRTHQVCLERLNVCTEKELFSPGYTPPCHFAQTQACKKACEEFHRESMPGILKLDEEKIISALKSAWESKLKGPGVSIIDIHKPTFTLKEYPNIIFASYWPPNSDYFSRRRFEETRRAAYWVEKLQLNKILVPATAAFEVLDDVNNTKQLFVATEEYNIPDDIIESYESFEKIYLEMAKNPALKEHMLQIFLQLVRLTPNIVGLYAEPQNMFLEKSVAMPQMVIKTIHPSVFKLDEDQIKKQLEWLFKGSRDKRKGLTYSPLAHPDFFDRMYEEAQKVVPGFIINNLDELKANKMKDINNIAGHRDYARKHKEQTKEVYLTKLDSIINALTAPQQKAARRVVRAITESIGNRRNKSIVVNSYGRKTYFSTQTACNEFLGINNILIKASISYLVECEEDKDSKGVPTGYSDVVVRW